MAVLVLGSGAFFALLDARPIGESDPRVLGLWVLAYAIAAAVLADALVRRRSSVRVAPELVVFLVLALASVAWSEAPVLTLRRAVGLLGTVLIGVALAHRLGPVQVLDAVRRAVLVVAVSSLLLYFSGSPLALDFIHGTLRGVVATKNSLGFFMALGLLACASCSLLDAQRWRRSALSAVPMIVALLFTDSKTGLVIAAVVAGATGLVLLGRRRRGRSASAVLLLVGAAAAVLAAPRASLAAAASLLGEDTTLTGRDAIWEESLRAAAGRPLGGYGYGAFWSQTTQADRIRELLMWDVPHGHNGLLDMLLDLGGLGVLAAAAVVTGLVVRGLFDVKYKRKAPAVVRLPLAGLIVASNLVESNLLTQNNLMTVLLAAALALPPVPVRPVLGRRTAHPAADLPSAQLSGWASSRPAERAREAHGASTGGSQQPVSGGVS